MTGLVGSLLALCALSASPALSDEYIFKLATGGEVRGKLLNPDDKPRQAYVIETTPGGKVTLLKDQVTEASRVPSRVIEYERLRPNFPDTVQGQWALAEWCRENLLPQQRETHLRRIIELDPNHEPARLGLGYFRGPAQQWVTREEVMLSRGYVKTGTGRWMLPQEVELQEQRRQQELAEKEWFRKLRVWRGWLSGPRAREARGNLTSIRDPLAVRALQSYLDPERERDYRVRDLIVECLGQIGSSGAIRSLVEASLNDPDEEVRLSALDELVKVKNIEIVRLYVGHLKSSDNTTINRAALGLAYMGDESAVGPLIEALVTTHKFKVVSGSDGINSTFSNGGAPGLSVGKTTRIYSRTFQNETVRDALVRLTGVNFGYSIELWRTWHATQLKEKAVNTRRDDGVPVPPQ